MLKPANGNVLIETYCWLKSVSFFYKIKTDPLALPWFVFRKIEIIKVRMLDICNVLMFSRFSLLLSQKFKILRQCLFFQKKGTKREFKAWSFKKIRIIVRDDRFNIGQHLGVLIKISKSKSSPYQIWYITFWFKCLGWLTWVYFEVFRTDD